MLEKTGQSRDTKIIDHTRHRTKTNKTKHTHYRKLKRWAK